MRNFTSVEGCEVKYVAEKDEERRQFVARSFPAIRLAEDPDAVFADAAVNGVVIATPASTHFDLAWRALEAGKHILVEKPLATTTAEVDALARLAEERGLVVMAGHTFLFNSAVRYVHDAIRSDELGEIRYIYSQRLNLGRIRTDIDALWNFAPHDISILQYWLGDPGALRVCRSGMSYVQNGIDDVVFLTIEYPKKIMAHIHVSWLDPQKVRTMVVVGSRKMIIYDDIAEEKIRIYDKGIDIQARLGERMDYDKPAQLAFRHRSGEVFVPKIDYREPLRVEAEHFIECIRVGTKPLTGIKHARSVVAVLERASKQSAHSELREEDKDHG